MNKWDPSSKAGTEPIPRNAASEPRYFDCGRMGLRNISDWWSQMDETGVLLGPYAEGRGLENANSEPYWYWMRPFVKRAGPIDPRCDSMAIAIGFLQFTICFTLETFPQITLCCYIYQNMAETETLETAIAFRTSLKPWKISLPRILRGQPRGRRRVTGESRCLL